MCVHTHICMQVYLVPIHIILHILYKYTSYAYVCCYERVCLLACGDFLQPILLPDSSKSEYSCR